MVKWFLTFKEKYAKDLLKRNQMCKLFGSQISGSKLAVDAKKGYIVSLARRFLYGVRNLRGCWWERKTMYLISRLKDSLFIHKTCNAVLNGKCQLFIRFLLHLVLFFTVLVFTRDTLNQTSILYLLKSSISKMWLLFEIYLHLYMTNSSMQVTLKSQPQALGLRSFVYRTLMYNFKFPIKFEVETRCFKFTIHISDV